MQYLKIFVLVNKFFITALLISTSLAYAFPKDGGVQIGSVQLDINDIYGMDIPKTIRAQPNTCVDITPRNKECTIGDASSWSGEINMVRVLVISNKKASGIYINLSYKSRANLLRCFADNKCENRVFK